MNQKSQSMVFIHGMYMTPLCWEHWIETFQAKGYACFAPAWPGRNRAVAELRGEHPDSQLGRLTLRAVIEHLAGVIQALDHKPILVGHSMGGLIAQLLLQRGLTSAAVAIDSAPPPGGLHAKMVVHQVQLAAYQPVCSPKPADPDDLRALSIHLRELPTS